MKTPREVKVFPVDGRGNIGVCVVYNDGTYKVEKVYTPTTKQNDTLAYAKQIAEELGIPVK